MNEELIAEAVLGDDAERFIESDLGLCIVGMAEQDAMDAQRKLADVDPEDAKAIRALQNEVRQAQAFPSYLRELITRGRNALEVLKYERQEN